MKGIQFIQNKKSCVLKLMGIKGIVFFYETIFCHPRDRNKTTARIKVRNNAPLVIRKYLVLFQPETSNTEKDSQNK